MARTLDFKIRGGTTLIDESDFDLVNQFDNWRIGNRGYAVRADRKKAIYMHRLILGLSGKYPFTDHKDHNRLNNTRENLREATPADNARNRKPGGRSKYLGVSYQKMFGKYEYIKAKIRVNNNLIHIGTFKTEEAAALAYNKAAFFYFGEFANLNIV